MMKLRSVLFFVAVSLPLTAGICQPHIATQSGPEISASGEEKYISPEKFFELLSLDSSDAVEKALSDNPQLVEVPNEDGWSPLLFAAYYGKQAVLRSLLQFNANVRFVDDGDNQALHLAASEGHDAIVGLLLGAKADINARNASGQTPLLAAIDGGHASTVKLLLGEPSLNLWFETEGNAAHMAAKLGEVDILKLLIARDKHLLDSGVRRASSFRGQSPLGFAAWGGQLEAAKFLLNLGASVNHRDRNGNTPLHLAATERGTLGIVQELTKKNAQRGHLMRSPLEARNNAGQTPLLVSIWSDKPDIAEYLLKKKANPNAADSAGNTPLWVAANAGRTELAKLLLKYRADPKIRNHSGESVREAAVRKGRPEIIKLLSVWKQR